MRLDTIINRDALCALRELPAESVHCCVTSPPYYALRDYGMATLVGTTSFGKGIVQALLPLDDGSAVKVTIAHYYTPAGHDIHKKGLEPDVEIELELDEDLIGQYDVPLDRDNQVQKAIEVLKQ